MENLGRLQQFPAKVIDVEDEERFGKTIPERIEHALLPAIGEVLRRIEILREEAVFIGDGEHIERGGDHVHVRNEDGLGEFSGEGFILFSEAFPETRRAFAQALGVEFGQVHARFETVVELIGFEFSDGDAADELRERVLAEAEEHLVKLHKTPEYHRG